MPSRARAGASAALEGALLLATQPVRSRTVPLAGAKQFEPATAAVVVVVGAVVVVVVVVVGAVVTAADAGEMVGARKLAMMASVAPKEVMSAARPPWRAWR